MTQLSRLVMYNISQFDTLQIIEIRIGINLIKGSVSFYKKKSEFAKKII